MDYLRAQPDWSDMKIEDLSDEQGMVAVQGPRAAALLEALAGPASVALGYYRCAVMEIAGIRALLSRNGYTGEDGFEIMCPADQVAAAVGEAPRSRCPALWTRCARHLAPRNGLLPLWQ